MNGHDGNVALKCTCNDGETEGFVIPFPAMSAPQPSVGHAAHPGTVRLALELLERTAGRRRRSRRHPVP